MSIVQSNGVIRTQNQQSLDKQNTDRAKSVPGPKLVSSVFGEIVWILSQSAPYQHITLKELELFVMIPITFRQFRLSYMLENPSEVELFAMVDDVFFEMAQKVPLFDRAKMMSARLWKTGQNELPIIHASIYQQSRLTQK